MGVSAAMRFLLFFLLLFVSDAFSQNKQEHSSSLATSNGPTISRRDYWKVSLGVAGGVAYAKLAGDTLARIARGIAYPPAHEERVEAVIATALAESSEKFKGDQPFRILEVGIGSECRILRRGLYDKGLQGLESKVSTVQLTGVDLNAPSGDAVQEAQDALSQQMGGRTELNVIAGDVTKGLSYPAGFFDCVICCLTLCSVTNQEGALQEMKRLMRPNGGTFGYVEHVAVDPEEPYRFLEWQQETLDPLQQLVADNCHLHRYTDDAIARVFGTTDENEPGARRLQHERFLVDDMWPVTCQCSGVIQRIA